MRDITERDAAVNEAYSKLICKESAYAYSDLQFFFDYPITTSRIINTLRANLSAVRIKNGLCYVFHLATPRGSFGNILSISLRRLVNARDGTYGFNDVNMFSSPGVLTGVRMERLKNLIEVLELLINSDHELEEINIDFKPFANSI